LWFFVSKLFEGEIKMSSKAIYCSVANRFQAQQIVNTLQMAGFPSREIAVSEIKSRWSNEGKSKGTNGAIAGVQIGIILGGIGGWLAGLGITAIPDVGNFVALEPILAAFGGAIVAGSLGGLAGAMIGAGIKEVETMEQESVVIAAHSVDPEMVDEAKDIFEQADAGEIAILDEEEEG
jgi:hypothetical protein